MDLQTQIPLEQPNTDLIDYNSKVLLLGSCFTENIGEKLAYLKFQNTINPFGILFHPKAIETTVINGINKKQFREEDVFFHNEQWHAFDAHSRLSRTTKKELLETLNDAAQLTYRQIAQSTHIIITLGTAWVYKHIEKEITVANCHKVSQKAFQKELLSVERIVASLQECVLQIQRVNPKTVVIFTVSPVRHIKDGFIENTLSKSHLITAVHQLIVSQEQTYYFPAFEIMMDELRDYRFYKTDMLHPNEVAVDYIWEKFKQVWLDSTTKPVMAEVDSIRKGLLHKPFNPNSDAHRRFLEQLKEKQDTLQSQFPHIVF